MTEKQAPGHYFHSVRLIEEKCRGCVNCIKYCPTEAIRVREGKAAITEVRCIDCGECVRHCPNQAKTAVADSLSRLADFTYTVALPAPALYGQFRGGIDPEMVLAGLLHLGFDDVQEVAHSAEIVSAVIRKTLREDQRVRPLLSSSCPAVVRLIQVRFPEFIDNIAPVVSPMCLSARIAKRRVSEQMGIPSEEIGVFFISPCPAKVSAVLDPLESDDSCVDGVIPISEIYPKLHNYVYGSRRGTPGTDLRKSSGVGIGWARAGGEIVAIGAKKHISVDGIHNVIEILEELEHGKLLDMDYIEMLACLGGCVGGVLTVENPFITRRRVRDLASAQGEVLSDAEIEARQQALLAETDPELLEFGRSIEPRPTLSLDGNMAEAIRKMERLEEIVKSLPGLDCGSCGAPNCRALAEDIVRDLATETDCVFILRERVRELAAELQALASKMPPAMGMEKR